MISASTNIGKGNLNSKVPEIKTDKELEVLNKNFNQMIDKIQNPNIPMLESNDLLNINFNEIDHEKLSTLGLEL